ncbi:MAG: GyrI-like domain-containing protein [Armatimonadetes bacterium]|nr:GyrI-like domain-containing protein [Armatimonadota bacterium]
MAEFQIVDYPAYTGLVAGTMCAPDALGSEIPRLLGFIWNSNPEAEMTDAPCVYYLEWEAHAKVECVVPVAPSTAPQGGATIKDFAATSAFMGVHQGHYQTLKDTWTELWNEVGRLGLQPSGPPWERYMTDPEEEPDPNNWVTEVYVPVTIQKF